MNRQLVSLETFLLTTKTACHNRIEALTFLVPRKPPVKFSDISQETWSYLRNCQSFHVHPITALIYFKTRNVICKLYRKRNPKEKLGHLITDL